MAKESAGTWRGGCSLSTPWSQLGDRARFHVPDPFLAHFCPILLARDRLLRSLAGQDQSLASGEPR